MLCVVVVVAVMSSNIPKIVDGINMHNPVVYFLDDLIGDYTDALLIIRKILSILNVVKYVILMFIPAKKHGRKKPLLQRSDVYQLSLQTLQDGFKSSDSVNCEENTKQDAWSCDLDITIREADACHKSDQQKNFLTLVKFDKQGNSTVKYQFLEVDDISKIAIVCKQPQFSGDKAVCFIDISDSQVTNAYIWLIYSY